MDGQRTNTMNHILMQSVQRDKWVSCYSCKTDGSIIRFKITLKCGWKVCAWVQYEGKSLLNVYNKETSQVSHAFCFLSLSSNECMSQRLLLDFNCLYNLMFDKRVCHWSQSFGFCCSYPNKVTLLGYTPKWNTLTEIKHTAYCYI